MTLPALRPWLPHVAAPLAVALAVALVGPFGTFAEMGLGARLLYWGAIIPLNWVQMELLAGAARRRVANRWAAMAVAVVLASVPATAEVAVLESLLRPGGRQFALWQLYGWVAVLTAALSAPVWLLRTRGAEAPVTEAAPAGGEAPFLRRVPARLGHELLCLRMEDHYLRVFTALGDDLILMRLRDAEAELAGEDGLRVHRSWWVARRAVRRVRRDGERLLLELSNGLEVPVSRSYAAAVRAAGWDAAPSPPGSAAARSR